MARQDRTATSTVTATGRGMSRREMLQGLGFGLGATVFVAGCAVPTPAVEPRLPPPGAPDSGPFPDGVMAGDPAPDGSGLWTRVLAPLGGGAVPVMWTVADDASFDSIRAAGLVSATADTGHTVQVQVAGLEPDRWYHYRFEAPGPDGAATTSRTGRLRTAPAPGAAPDRLRFAFGSCQQLNDSWFNAHAAIAAEPDLDFFMHLGDYVYVSDEGTLTLEQYRDAYRRWRGQPMLRDLHAALPCVAMWDDGEFYNGVDAAGPADRLAAAKRAWFESFPLAVGTDAAGTRRSYRAFGWGALADVTMIDVRSYRDPAIDDITHIGASGLDDPGRTTLGAEQYGWLTGGLAASTASWRVIGNPYNIAPWKLIDLEFLRLLRPDMPPEPGIYAPNEAWDDYMAERRDLLGFLVDHDVHDTVFASAHTHIAISSDLRADRPAQRVAAHDFCAGSLTADPDPRRAYLGDLPLDVAEELLRVAERFMLGQNQPGMRHLNMVDQGYTVVDVTPEEMLVTYRTIDTTDPDAEAVDAARFRLRPGDHPMEVLPTPRARGSVV